MHDGHTFLIEVAGESAAATNIAARQLRETIERAAGDEIAVDFLKERADTQDLGATLGIVLGSQAVVVLARAVYAFVSRHGDKVIIKTVGGSVVASGSAAKNIDVSRTIEELRARLDD